MPRKKYYTLTQTAEKDFRQARQWSLSRWGKERTKQYFVDLHQGANYIAKNQQAIAERDHLVAETGLGVYPVKEHYIVYLPVETDFIIIVGLIRQSRNVPSILQANQYRICREVKEIKDKRSQ